jgi:hypothetical protein
MSPPIDFLYHRKIITVTGLELGGRVILGVRLGKIGQGGLGVSTFHRGFSLRLATLESIIHKHFYISKVCVFSTKATIQVSKEGINAFGYYLTPVIPKE